MKTLIVGGGQGCKALLELDLGSFLKELSLNVTAVCDNDPEAPGLIYAEEIGLNSYPDFREAINTEDPELIIELTGNKRVTRELFFAAHPGMRIIDHKVAQIFWDLVRARQEQIRQMNALYEMEEIVRNEKHFLQSIFDSQEDLAVVVDKGFSIFRANRRFAEFTGVSPDEAFGKDCCTLLEGTELECDHELEQDLINKVYAEGKPQKLIRLTRPNDENHWEINRQPIFNKNDEVESVLITWHRITEQVMLHRRIETQEQQFIRFIHSAQDWISIKDTEGRYLIVNPVTAEAMKIPLEEFIGKKPSELLPPGLVKQIEENDRIVLNDKKPRTFREIIPIDGQDHHFQTVRFPLMDYSGKITGVCTIARDITNEVMLKDQLIQYEKLAGLGKLAAGVAHEINNPLTGILAYAEGIAEDHEDDVELTSDMDVIIRETLRCREIVRNLLDFARQDKPRFSRVTVSRLMNDTFNLIKKLKQFKNIEFIIQEDDEDRALDIDINQMRQVMLNLLLNSADVMNGKGRILISYGPDRRDSYYRITIEDNGPGIPEDIVDKIFEPFFSTKGTSGLGLAVSLGIVQMHGGTIEVSNAAGCGARFNIILPMER